jgi:hypothetical protein
LSFRSRHTVLALVFALSGAGAAAGQTAASDRPFRGLFGAGDSKERGPSLSLDWGLAGAYDDNVASETTTDPRFVIGGKYGAANGALTYNIQTEHRSFGVVGTAIGRYYPDLHELSALEGGGGASFASDLGRRTKISLSQNFTYKPYYDINFLGSIAPSGAAVVDVGDHAGQIGLGPRSGYGIDGRFGLTRTLAARSSLRADYSYRLMQFSGSDENFSWRLASIGYARNLTRYAALRVGYGYGVGKNDVAVGASSTVNHNLDLGVDYDRQLSFSRRTRLNFSSGSTAVVDAGVTRYRLIGNAGLDHEIGRTWKAQASYNRGVQYLPGFARTFYSDTAQVGVAGLLGRRLGAGLAGGFSAGQLGFGDTAEAYSSQTANGDLRLAVSQTLSFFAQYTYYRYGFDAGAPVPFGLPPRLDRQSIRFGISGWLPLIR